MKFATNVSLLISTDVTAQRIKPLHPGHVFRSRFPTAPTESNRRALSKGVDQHLAPYVNSSVDEGDLKISAPNDVLTLSQWRRRGGLNEHANMFPVTGQHHLRRLRKEGSPHTTDFIPISGDANAGLDNLAVLGFGDRYVENPVVVRLETSNIHATMTTPVDTHFRRAAISRRA